MERGDRRNYSVSFDDNELIFMLPVEEGAQSRGLDSGIHACERRGGDPPGIGRTGN